MKRSHLEHIIRAASSITGDSEIVILGSQAILGQFPEAPEDLLRSVGAEIFPKNIPELFCFSFSPNGFLVWSLSFHDSSKAITFAGLISGDTI